MFFILSSQRMNQYEKEFGNREMDTLMARLRYEQKIDSKIFEQESNRQQADFNLAFKCTSRAWYLGKCGESEQYAELECITNMVRRSLSMRIGQ